MSENKPDSDLSSLRIDKDKKFDDRPKNKKWWILVWLLIAAAVVVAYFIIEERVKPATAVKVGTAEMLTGSSAQADLVATGYVVAQRKAEVASKGTGRLEFLGFEEGDSVKKGEVIARLDNDDIKANLDLAKAQLMQAEVDTLQAGRNFRRAQDLLKSGAITKSIFEDAESAHKSSLAQLAAAKATVKSSEVAVENTYIRAPFDGTVLTKNADIGDVVAPFASSASSKGSVVTLADMSSLEVEADVSESYINRVSVNQRTEIILDAYPNEVYTGHVKKIVPTADRTRATVLTKVAFDNIDDKVLPEMSARINFFMNKQATGAKPVESALVVPKEAITTRGNNKVLFVINNDRIQMNVIRIGRELGDLTEILEGINLGDRVVLSPPGKLVDGEKIEISN